MFRVSEEIKNANLQGEEDSQDVFSRMMFSTRKTAKSELESPSSPAQQDEESPFMQLMSQIDDIYTSIQNLKPIINEFSPIIDFLKKKLKS